MGSGRHDGRVTTSVDVVERVAWITLDRPERLNSFTVDDYRDLGVAFARADRDPDVRVIVLTAAGRAFSAGADRSVFHPGDGCGGRHAATGARTDGAAEEFAAFLTALDECRVPLLAAVNGLAVGIGCTLLLHCDLVIAAESARFRLPFTSLGIVPEAGSSVLLPAATRRADAVWAMLSSEWVDAPSARDMGLVWRVVADDDLGSAAARAAGTLAGLDPTAVAATKRLLLAGRSDAVRLAMDREMAAMGRLAAERADADRVEPTSGNPAGNRAGTTTEGELHERR